MSALKGPVPALERLLAGLLDYGTWIAAGVIAVGLVEAYTLPAQRGMFVVKLGIGLMIALPVIRVILMLLYFMKVDDRRFGVIAGLVLIIISAGVVLGLRG